MTTPQTLRLAARPRVFILPAASATPHDVSDAKRFGELVEIAQPGDGGFYGREAIARITVSLASFSEDDYLVAGVGHPLSVAWASAIAAQKTRGRLRLLYWNRKRREYIPIMHKIFEAA